MNPRFAKMLNIKEDDCTGRYNTRREVCLGKHALYCSGGHSRGSLCMVGILRQQGIRCNILIETMNGAPSESTAYAPQFPKHEFLKYCVVLELKDN